MADEGCLRRRETQGDVEGRKNLCPEPCQPKLIVKSAEPGIAVDLLERFAMTSAPVKPCPADAAE